MFLLAGISAKIKPRGVSRDCACPACGRISNLHVTHKYMTPHVFFIPTFHFHSEYIATCSSCAGVMLLDKEKGRAFQKDPTTKIYPEDLEILKRP